MMQDMTETSSRGLLVQLSDSIASLVRHEVDLLRAELEEKTHSAAQGIGFVIAGAIVALTALNVLSAALVSGITSMGIEPGWASLGVGTVFAVLALLFVIKGSNDLKRASPKPQRTIRSVRDDARMVKEGVR
jgi:hypothetical protein